MLWSGAMEDAGGKIVKSGQVSRKVVDVAAGEAHTLLLTGKPNSIFCECKIEFEISNFIVFFCGVQGMAVFTVGARECLDGSGLGQKRTSFYQYNSTLDTQIQTEQKALSK